MGALSTALGLGCGDRGSASTGGGGTGGADSDVGTEGSSGVGEPSADGDSSGDDGTKLDVPVGETDGTNCPPDHESECNGDSGTGDGGDTGDGGGPYDPPGLDCECPAVWTPDAEMVVTDPFDLSPSGAGRGAMRAAMGDDAIAMVYADGTQMRLERLDPTGVSLGSSVLPFDIAPIDQTFIGGMVITSIAWAGSGWVIGYLDEDGARLAAIDADGEPIAGPIALDDDAPDGGYHPVVVYDGEEVRAVWIEAPGGQIAQRRFTPSLSPTTDPVEITDDAQAGHYSLAASWVGDRLGVVFMHRDPTDFSYGPHVSLVDSDDVAQLVDLGEEASNPMKLGIVGNGDAAAVCWMYESYPSPSDVRCRFMATDGDLLGATEIVNPTTHLAAGAFDLVPGPCGDFIVALHSSVPYSGSYDAWLATGDPDSATWTRTDLPWSGVSYNVELLPTGSALAALVTQRIQPGTDNHVVLRNLGC